MSCPIQMMSALSSYTFCSYWLGLQSQLGELIVEDQVRISRFDMHKKIWFDMHVCETRFDIRSGWCLGDLFKKNKNILHILFVRSLSHSNNDEN